MASVAHEPPSRSSLLRICQIALAVLGCKVLLTILLEYRGYFPADFDSSFLSGRRYTFTGWYRIGFYTHILASPLALVLAAFLIVSQGMPRFARAHRLVGRMLAGLVLCLLLPSSLVMASKAYAGPIAATAFATLALATAFTCVLAAIRARERDFHAHRRWAMRCFLLLCSPLLLRLMSGAAIMTGWESDLTYRLNAWASWGLPLIAFEVWNLVTSTPRNLSTREVQ